MRWRAIGLLLGAALLWLDAGIAQADPHTYAIVVGSNQAGHGQAPLEFAAQDAQRFAELLIELGRTPVDHVQLVLDPSPQGILQALAQLRLRLGVHARAGESSKLVFYYSGHARSRALSLGQAELSLETLRQALLSLPSTLTVVVLDACQSGAFSGVKGAAAAADFSVSSVFDLRNEGVAVMASSTAAELSQESPELQSSYFTHHLITGLRGAADHDGDGIVSLDEVYRYAYQNTLSDTVRTRVGSQHATLETELKGHGNVPLTYTADADARLLLPEAIEGRIAIQQKARRAVVAELSKAAGSVLSLALPHGDYEVLVRRGIALAPQLCDVWLPQHGTYTLDTSGCPTAALPAHTAKGDSRQFERWFIEVGVAWTWARNDGYVATLEDFGFRDQGSAAFNFQTGSFGPQFAGGFALHPYVELLAQLERLDTRTFFRHLPAAGDAFSRTHFALQTWALELGARARLPLLDERIVPFAELDLGAGFGRSKLKLADTEDEVEWHVGPVLRADLGATFHFFWRIGATLSGGYTYAPALENEIGNTHDDGGWHVRLALRLRGLSGGT